MNKGKFLRQEKPSCVPNFRQEGMAECAGMQP